MSLLRTACIAAALGAATLGAMAQSPLATYEGADRMERLIAAAKKEGTLTLYTTIAEKDLPALIKPFETRYGIKVNVWRAGTDKVLQRTLAEAAANRHEVDAVHVGSPEREALSRDKVLQPVNSPTYRNLQPGSVPAHKEWAATLLSVWVQAYNTNLIKKEDLPKTYQDLLDPKWKGKLSVEAGNYHWFATLMELLGQENGRKLFRQIVNTNGIEVRKGHSAMANLVVAGELPLALTQYQYKPAQLKARGETIDWFGIQPVAAHLRGVGVLKSTPRPHAAMLFYDFMLSDAQQILASRQHYPTSMKVDSPLKQLKPVVIDPTRTLQLGERWMKEYEDMLKPGGK